MKSNHSQTLLDLFRHMEWADALVWRAATADDPKIRQWLTHIHNVQRGFLSMWKGVPPDFRQAASFTDLAAIREWGREYYAHDLPPFLESLDDDALQRPVSLPWAEEIIGKPPEPVTLEQTMMQVSQHSTYHRGQVNARLRELGVEPPLVDLIAWYWHGRPAAEW
jgi:uncharacterized damage-inducible protein DinB